MLASLTHVNSQQTLVYIGMFIYKELLLTAVLYAGFVVLAYLGWREWYKIRQQHTADSAL